MCHCCSAAHQCQLISLHCLSCCLPCVQGFQLQEQAAAAAEERAQLAAQASALAAQLEAAKTGVAAGQTQGASVRNRSSLLERAWASAMKVYSRSCCVHGDFFCVCTLGACGLCASLQEQLQGRLRSLACVARLAHPPAGIVCAGGKAPSERPRRQERPAV